MIGDARIQTRKHHKRPDLLASAPNFISQPRKCLLRSNEHDQFKSPYSAFLGSIRHGGTTTSPATTRTPSAAPLHAPPNSPATELLQSAINSPATVPFLTPAKQPRYRESLSAQPVIIPVPSQYLPLCSPLIRQTHASASSPRNFAKLRSPYFQTHGLLKLDLVISYSVALLFDSVSCRALLSCRWPPHPSRCIVSVANNQRRLVNFCERK